MVPKILQIIEFERKEVYNILSTFFYLTKRKTFLNLERSNLYMYVFTINEQ